MLRPSFHQGATRDPRFTEDLKMPYKDLRRKTEWERLHRPQRLARRRELRRIEAARNDAQPEVPTVHDQGAAVLLPILAGSALAAYNPKLAIGAGGLTLLAAAIYKKGSTWWIVGVLTLALGLFFQWNDKNENK
jgi:hypothetical protein